ncbi:MAG: pro-sigmaK processing inhibitor BofA family protein [Tissierella sp.]|uniref:pro-sigmaK processing inhibitor BofA family protein n=1 Tax=Tissierella sp. TaxID=41274 RepID=UPI003F970FF1
MDITTILFYLAGLILVYVVGMILVVPLKLLVKLLMNGIAGGVFLFLFNIIGGMFNLSLAINPLNAIIVGFLGVPGVILLLVFNFIL